MAYLNFILEKPSKRIKSAIPDPYFEHTGNIVEDYNFPSALIVQLNNCVSRKLHPYSFSWNLAVEFFYANPYRRRLAGPFPNLASQDFRSTPGTIELLYPPSNYRGPTFACFYGQYRMGNYNSQYFMNSSKVDRDYKYMSLRKDTYQDRLRYFQECLDQLLIKLSSTNNYECVVFPKGIGSGMAGGRWKDYEALISSFAVRLKKDKPKLVVVIVNYNFSNVIPM